MKTKNKDKCKRQLRELDKKLRKRGEYLVLNCIPYDKDKEYQEMLKLEEELEAELKNMEIK